MTAPRPLRVVHVNAFDASGGAARSAYRLHRGLAALGVDSAMVVRRKATDDPAVHLASPVGASVRAVLDQELHRLFRRRPRSFFTTAVLPDRTAPAVARLAPDVVNRHWVGEGFLRPESVARLPRPVVWTLHDAWAFTGGCHVTGACERFVDGCGACEVLGSTRERDLSRWVLGRKRRAWSDVALTIVAPSRWMAERARRSALLAGRRVEVIPNGVDTSVFRPLAQGAARELLRLPPDGRLVLFLAMDGVSDPNKGFHLLREALGHGAPAGAGLLVAGASSIPAEAAPAVPTHALGRLQDDVSLALAYASADVVVVPSIQENLPNTALEALACGRPVVAFRVGGLPDLVEDGVNGALVDPFDTAGLARALAWTLEDAARWRALCEAARARAERDHGTALQARRYLALYEDLTGRAAGARVTP